MVKITAAHPMSLDGFIAGPDGGAAVTGMHDWMTASDTPSQANPAVTMARPNAKFFDQGISRCDTFITGRWSYNLSRAWAGRGERLPVQAQDPRA